MLAGLVAVFVTEWSPANAHGPALDPNAGSGFPEPGGPYPEPNLRIYEDDDSVPTSDIEPDEDEVPPTSDEELLERLIASNWFVGARATCLLAATTAATERGTLTFVPEIGEEPARWAIHEETAQKAFDICADDDYAYLYREPSVGFCTGFFVRTNLVLTAAHCLDDYRDELGEIRVVLDYAADENGALPTSLDPANVLDVELVVEGQQIPGIAGATDWALLSLRDLSVDADRVVDRCSSFGDCDTSGDLFAVTHPLGMPQRVLTEGRRLSAADGSIQTNLDAFAGGSGSPVFDSLSGRLIGMLISGLPDFDPAAGCRRTAVSPDEPISGQGERVLLIDALPDALKTAL